MIIIYSLYSLIARPTPKKLQGIWSYITGFPTRLAGAICIAGGPPTIIYTALSNRDINKTQAMLTFFSLYYRPDNCSLRRWKPNNITDHHLFSHIHPIRPYGRHDWLILLHPYNERLVS